MTKTDRLIDVNAESIRIRGACVGCGAEIFYVIEFAVASAGEILGAPAPEPESFSHVQHGHGHLCPPCSGAVADLLRRRREDRDQNHGAVVRGHR